MNLSVRKRLMAVKVFYTSGSDLDAAVKRWAVETDGNASMKVDSPRKFIAKWVNTFESTGTVLDAARSGRPSITAKLGLRRIQALAAAFKKGRCVAGNTIYYSSIEEAIQHDNRFQKALDESEHTARTLLDAMRAADPDMIKTSERTKGPISAANTQERLATAHELKRLRQEEPSTADFIGYSDKIIQIDAKKLYIGKTIGKNGKRVVWIDKHDQQGRLVHVDRRVKKVVAVYYYAAVNALVGPVAIVWTTSSTGSNKGANPWLVSVATCP